MTVGEFCTREVVIIRKDDTVIEAARLMRDHHVGDLVVVEETEGQRIPVGILTDRDIVLEVIAKEADYLPALTVGDIMSMELLTVPDDENLADALKRMCSRGVRRIPVVNKSGSLEGILSIDDLLEQLCEELTDITKLIAWQQKRERDERA
jgi:CBS domain-containing protein